MSTLCPSCGRPDTSGRDFCARCGEYLRWDATEEHPRRVRDAPTVQLPTLARSPAVVLLNLDADTAPTAYLVPFGAGDGSEQDFELALTPPRAPGALAQPWPFTLEAVSRNS